MVVEPGHLGVFFYKVLQPVVDNVEVLCGQGVEMVTSRVWSTDEVSSRATSSRLPRAIFPNFSSCFVV